MSGKNPNYEKAFGPDLLQGHSQPQKIQPRPLWEQVKELEENYDPDAQKQLKMARATMLVNFGPEGREKQGLVTEDMGMTKMIVEVLRFYAKPPKNTNQ